MLMSLKSLPPDGATFDVVVIGAGGAGMSAALTAAIANQRVLLIEQSSLAGGTTAWSAGTTWIPATHHAARIAPDDSIEQADRFLTRAVGAHSSHALRRVFLARGSEALDYLEQHSDVAFRPFALHPDYLSEIEGAALTGRALDPLPFDGRQLGRLFRVLRPPIPEFTVFGGMMVDRTDIGHLLRCARSPVSLLHSLRLLWRHLRDRLRHPRGTRLVMGNALAGRLLLSLSKRPNLALALRTHVEKLHLDERGVHAVTLTHSGVKRTVGVSGGVIFATGGFNRDAVRRAQLLPGAAGADSAWCACAPGPGGPAHDVAMAAGAHYGSGAITHAFWAPVSLRQRADGSAAVYPHFVHDRSKPGTLCVNQAGQRFVNESTSYHLFALAMQAEQARAAADAAHPSAIPAYLIADSKAMRKYGLGMVRPGGRGLAPFFADGYLERADTLETLAAKLGIDPAGLRHSVERINRFAASGVDEDFWRGSTVYQRHNGDAAAASKNPCLGPLKTAPFYALRLYPGDIGAATGFATDVFARVLGADGQPVHGLYAAGNDMHSIMGGVYAAPGITLGPALVFGYIAARHAAQRSEARRSKEPHGSGHQRSEPGSEARSNPDGKAV